MIQISLTHLQKAIIIFDLLPVPFGKFIGQSLHGKESVN